MERRIPVTTLARVCEQYHVPTIDFLKIDVEGYEREVLEGADWERYRPRVVLVEATKPLATTPTHEHWESILLSADYRFAFFDGMNRYYVRGEDRELMPLLSVPANYFDDFERYPHLHRVQDLEHQIQHLRRSNEEMLESRDSVRRDLEQTRAVLAGAREELAGAREELAGAHQELAGAHQELAGAHAALAATRQELDTTTAALDQAGVVLSENARPAHGPASRARHGAGAARSLRGLGPDYDQRGSAAPHGRRAGTASEIAAPPCHPDPARASGPRGRPLLNHSGRPAPGRRMEPIQLAPEPGGDREAQCAQALRVPIDSGTGEGSWGSATGVAARKIESPQHMNVFARCRRIRSQRPDGCRIADR